MYAYFSSQVVASDINCYSVEFDMLDVNSSSGGTSYELLFYGADKPLLKLAVIKDTTGKIRFENYFKYTQAGDSVSQARNVLTSGGKTVYLTAGEWMHISIRYYNDATNPYGVLEVSQNGNTYSMTFTSTWGAASTRAAFDTFDVYASYAKYGDSYIDNVTVTNYSSGAQGLGYYHFDNVTGIDNLPQLELSGGTTVEGISHGENRNDKYIALSAAIGGSVSARLTGNVEQGYYNFNEVQVDLRFDEYEVGDKGSFAVNDSMGRTILTIGYEIIKVEIDGVTYESVCFYEATSGKILLAGEYAEWLEKDGVAVNPLDYVIDPSEWITLRFEYHYDMSTPTLYLTAKYTDGEGLSDAKAAILTGLPVAGADASDMDSVSLNTTAARISIDNFYIRNVYDERS